MPTVRLTWRDFRKGWYGAGARDAQPDGTLRRAVGIAQVKTTELRSRWGSHVVAALDAHSIVRFNGHRYVGVDSAFMDLAGTVLQGGLDGTRLAFVRMGPTATVTDYLFVAGGGTLFKLSPTGVVSSWGIAPPPDGLQAVSADPTTVAVDALDTAASWTPVSCTLSDEPTIKQEGAASMKMTVAASTVGTASKAIIVDLSNASESPDEDFIQVWFRVDVPANVSKIQMFVDVTPDANFASNYYVRDIAVAVATDPLSEDQLRQAAPGLDTSVANLAAHGFLMVQPPSGGTEGQADFWATTPMMVFDPANGIPIPVTDPVVVRRLLDLTSQTSVASTFNTWTLLRVPKAAFQRVGGGAGTWATVSAVRFLVETNANVGGANAYWDDLKLSGGVGMQGSYGYQVVYLNDTTGTRSDPNPTEVRVSRVNRGAVQLSVIPVPTDPQVSHVEVYRTVGNGTLKFRVAKLASGTTTWLDRVADSVTINTMVNAEVMSSIQLELDNARPNDAWDDCFGPHAGSMWWCRSLRAGERGTVFFSPAGRAESGVGGYLVLTSDDEPTMKGVIYNGAAFVFTTMGLFQIVGTGTPFVARRVYGVPGTLWPLSVTVTPTGIAYLALDGPRRYNGTDSQPIAPDACALLWRGEAVENVAFTT